MEIREFIGKLFNIYTNSWQTSNEDDKKDMYYKALSNPNIDFDKLTDFIAENHHGEFMPTPADLKDMSVNCLKKTSYVSNKDLEFILYDPILKGRNSIVAQNSTTEAQVIKYLQKKTCVKEGWKILQIKESK